MKTIRQLAKQSGLSRSTLLYYDRRGLLRPDYRTSSGHRLYSPEDEARLGRICQLREAGLPLGEIDAVLEPSRALRTPLNDALNRRLTELNREIAGLRRQQQVVVSLLKQPSAARRSRIMTKEKWVALLRAIGLDEDDRQRWHFEFERLSPEAHQDFLESLGLPSEEIRAIRRFSASRSPLRPEGTFSCPDRDTKMCPLALHRVRFGRGGEWADLMSVQEVEVDSRRWRAAVPSRRGDWGPSFPSQASFRPARRRPPAVLFQWTRPPG